jgi:hypothetical protein
MIQVPELKLLSILKDVIKFIKEDTKANSANEKNSFLYKMFYGLKVDDYDFYESSKEMFLRSLDHPRPIQVNMFFNQERAHIPTIHITLPGKSTDYNGIGIDDGYQDDFFDETTKLSYPVYTRTFNTKFNVVVTSDNTYEVLIIFNVLESILISSLTSIELNGLLNARLGGFDLQINSENIPMNIFARALSIDFAYEINIPRFFGEKKLSNVTFTGTPGDE